ncbi:hypothetical protein [Methanimicrococcus blatticola]|uniref:Uncharacterized protein n=1 Tax=Methanimicrococcus blatticola TaxID=91560 RepID=A0A484F3R8_9EURY|nr:hypothetical protein [Methanimicrococcus blatticola]MBZ3935746.1 hypothetical protein [Methanimicrococcus blatticola]MCC2508134.1 hypothetical protein [Methanimicrococcus blatticola]TDQ68788.1 hypothetical protein C7391_0984 [Methanimicrococcus blatticola]
MEKMKDILGEPMDLVIVSLNEDEDYGICVISVRDDDPIYQIKMFQNPLDLEDKSLTKALEELEDYSKVFTEESNDIYEILNVHRDFWLQPEITSDECDKLPVTVVSSWSELEEVVRKGKLKGLFNYFALDDK